MKFSIITVVYNSVATIERTIISVLEQTHQNIEYIIIDGNSSDGTLKIINKYKNQIDKIVSEPDKGIYDAMNKGIKFLTGDYCLFLNAGDVFYSKTILEEINQISFSNNTPDIIYGNVNIYNENGNFIKYFKVLSFTKTNLNMYTTRTLCHQSIFVNKDILCNYSTKFFLKGELDWYYNLLEKMPQLKIVKVNKVISNYFLGGIGDRNFWKNYFEQLKVVREHNSRVVFILLTPFFFIPLIFKLKSILLKKRKG